MSNTKQTESRLVDALQADLPAGCNMEWLEVIPDTLAPHKARLVIPPVGVIEVQAENGGTFDDAWETFVSRITTGGVGALTEDEVKQAGVFHFEWLSMLMSHQFEDAMDDVNEMVIDHIVGECNNICMYFEAYPNMVEPVVAASVERSGHALMRFEKLTMAARETVEIGTDVWLAHVAELTKAMKPKPHNGPKALGIQVYKGDKKVARAKK